MAQWADPQGRAWLEADRRLRSAGVSPQQVAGRVGETREHSADGRTDGARPEAPPRHGHRPAERQGAFPEPPDCVSGQPHLRRLDDDPLEPGALQNIAHGIARGIAIGIAFAIAFVLFIFLGGMVVQWLWNWLVPDIFALRRITFWEALGLLALCRILFGGFGRGVGHHRSSNGRGREWWKKRGQRADASPAPADSVSVEGQS